VATSAPRSYQRNAPVLGWIGAGNYGSRILIPAFRNAGAQFDALLTTGGTVHGTGIKGVSFATLSSNPADIFQNPAVNTVVVASRHNTHARFVLDAIASGRHVFVEKPLALSLKEVDQIEAAWRVSRDPSCHLMVGFNRRFSALVNKMKQLIEQVNEPVVFNYTCNAGALPSDHWLRDKEIGGGRLIGEV